MSSGVFINLSIGFVRVTVRTVIMEPTTRESQAALVTSLLSLSKSFAPKA